MASVLSIYEHRRVNILSLAAGSVSSTSLTQNGLTVAIGLKELDQSGENIDVVLSNIQYCYLREGKRPYRDTISVRATVVTVKVLVYLKKINML